VLVERDGPPSEPAASLERSRKAPPGGACEKLEGETGAGYCRQFGTDCR
jgi:hypothetical protein